MRKHRKRTKPNKLSKTASKFLSRLKSGEEMSYRDWAVDIYDDAKMVPGIYNLIRTLRKHGNFIAPVGGIGGDAGVLKIFPDDLAQSQEVENRYSRDISKRFGTYMEMVPVITSNHYSIINSVLDTVDNILRASIATRKSLELGTRAENKLLTDKK